MVDGHAIHGIAQDWTFHHVIFSDPGTEEQAIANGTHDHWLKVVNNPRYLLQQIHRGQPARGPHAAEVERAIGPALMKAAEHPAPQPTFANLPAPQFNAKGEQVLGGIGGKEVLLTGKATAVKAPPPKHPQYDNADQGRLAPKKSVSGSPLMQRFTEWHDFDTFAPEESLNSKSARGAEWATGSSTGQTGDYSLGSYTYPAMWVASDTSASCPNDWVLYPTGSFGTTTQANIIAYRNLYTGICTSYANPQAYFAYNVEDATGNSYAIETSPIIDYVTNNEVAFAAYNDTPAGVLVLLKFKLCGALNCHNGTDAAPITLVSVTAANYPTCTAPCALVLPFANGYRNSVSAPYWDYGSDSIYVGDVQGYLHKFIHVFEGTAANPPQEVTSAPWPILLNSVGYRLAAPVYDDAKGFVYVGDTYGYVYAVTASGVVAASTYWGEGDGLGFWDAPVVDSNALAEYFPLTGISTAISGGYEYNAILNFYPGLPCPPCSTTNAAYPGLTGVDSLGSTYYEYLWSGAFDNAYYNSANPANPSGNMYVLGNTDGYYPYLDYDIPYYASTLFQIVITNDTIAAENVGPPLGYNEDDYGAGGPVVEFYNANSAVDYLFTTDVVDGGYTPGVSSSCVTGAEDAICPDDYLADAGCVMSFNAAQFATTQASLGTGLFQCAYYNAPPASGMTVAYDGTNADATNFYFDLVLGVTGEGTVIDYPCTPSGAACTTNCSPCATYAAQAAP